MPVRDGVQFSQRNNRGVSVEGHRSEPYLFSEKKERYERNGVGTCRCQKTLHSKRLPLQMQRVQAASISTFVADPPCKYPVRRDLDILEMK